jgi:membrane protease YdiL (CAAX protease family)
MRTSSPILDLLNKLFSDARPLTQFLILIVVMSTSYLLITFIGLLLALPIFSIKWIQLQNAISEGFQDTDIGIIYFLQGIQTLGLFIIPAVVSDRILFKQGSGFLTGRNSRIHTSTVLVLIILILSAPILQWLIQWNAQIKLPEVMKGIEGTLKKMENERDAIAEYLLSGTGLLMFLINILIIAILPALGEEFIFRGVFQRLLINWLKNEHIGILITALFFSVFHLQFYGLIPRLLLGVFLGYLYLWSGTIWLPVIAHFFNNTIAIVVAYLSSVSDSKIPDFLKEDYNFTLPMVLLSVILTYISIVILRNHLLHLHRRKV